MTPLRMIYHSSMEAVWFLDKVHQYVLRGFSPKREPVGRRIVHMQRSISMLWRQIQPPMLIVVEGLEATSSPKGGT